MEALAPWLLALFVIPMLWCAAKRKRRPGRVRTRTDEHEAFLTFLSEILANEETVALMVRRGCGTRAGIAAAKEMLGDMSEPGLRACAAQLLHDRLVRRHVAKYVTSFHGGDSNRFLRWMGTMVGEVTE